MTPVPDRAEHSITDELVARLRELCLALPETIERLRHGEPTWFVRKKTFVMFYDHHHGGPLGIWCAAPAGAQEALIEAAPDRFFRPPYVGYRGWLGVNLEAGVDWDELAEVVTDAYRCVAPPRLAQQIVVPSKGSPPTRPRMLGPARRDAEVCSVFLAADTR